MNETEFDEIMVSMSTEIAEASEAEGKLLPGELGPLSTFDINAIED